MLRLWPVVDVHQSGGCECSILWQIRLCSGMCTCTVAWGAVLTRIMTESQIKVGNGVDHMGKICV